MTEKCRLCDEKVRAHGLCGKHYMRMARYGDPEIVMSERKQKVKSVAIKEITEKISEKELYNYLSKLFVNREKVK